MAKGKTKGNGASPQKDGKRSSPIARKPNHGDAPVTNGDKVRELMYSEALHQLEKVDEFLRQIKNIRGLPAPKTLHARQSRTACLLRLSAQAMQALRMAKDSMAKGRKHGKD